MFYKISQEDFADDPRCWDNMTEMCLHHRKYNVANETFAHTADFDSWDEMRRFLEKEYAVVVPVYMYDHSGVSIDTTPFSCRWDSGQIGFCVISKEKIQKEFGWTNMTKGRRAKLERIIDQEVKTYSAFLNGDVYRFTIYDDNGEFVDSCGDYYGWEDCEAEAKSHMEYLIKSGRNPAEEYGLVSNF